MKRKPKRRRKPLSERTSKVLSENEYYIFVTQGVVQLTGAPGNVALLFSRDYEAAKKFSKAQSKHARTSVARVGSIGKPGQETLKSQYLVGYAEHDVRSLVEVAKDGMKGWAPTVETFGHADLVYSAKDDKPVLIKDGNGNRCLIVLPSHGYTEVVNNLDLTDTEAVSLECPYLMAWITGVSRILTVDGKSGKGKIVEVPEFPFEERDV